MLKQITNALKDTGTIARRNLIRNVKSPQLIVFSTVQPVMILLLFNFVFGGAIRLTPGLNKYIDYLLPGLIVQAILFTSTQAVIAMNADMMSGLIDRFKTLPISRIAVVFGRVLADTVRTTFILTIMMLLGLLLGFHPTQGVLNGILAIIMVIGFGFVFSWVSVTIGLLAKDAESAQAAGFIWVFPLAFASSIFVPVSSMPGWLQGFAANQPISLVANSVRGLTITGDTSDVIPALIWLVSLFVAFFIICNRLYNRKVS